MQLLAKFKKSCTFQSHLKFSKIFIRWTPLLKGQCHEDFAVLGQICAKIITSRL